MKSETRKLLAKCGVPQHILGYQYLGTAIEAVLEHPEYLNRITGSLYPFIAKEHQTTTTRVERAIRHAVEIGFDRIDCDFCNELFGWSVDKYRGKPTNSHFIAALAEELKDHEAYSANRR